MYILNFRTQKLEFRDSMWNTTFRTSHRIRSVFLLFDRLFRETNAGLSSSKTTTNTQSVGTELLLPPLCPTQDRNTFRISLFHCKTKCCILFVILLVKSSDFFASAPWHPYLVSWAFHFPIHSFFEEGLTFSLSLRRPHNFSHSFFFFTIPHLPCSVNDILEDL